MTAFFRALRAVTAALLAACVITAVFAGITHLFLLLAFPAAVGLLLLGIRARWRSDWMRKRS